MEPRKKERKKVNTQCGEWWKMYATQLQKKKEKLQKHPLTACSEYILYTLCLNWKLHAFTTFHTIRFWYYGGKCMAKLRRANIIYKLWTFQRITWKKMGVFTNRKLGNETCIFHSWGNFNGMRQSFSQGNNQYGWNIHE